MSLVMDADVSCVSGRLSMSLVMEYLPYGSLIVYLESHRQVDTRRMLLFASQICSVRGACDSWRVGMIRLRGFRTGFYSRQVL